MASQSERFQAEQLVLRFIRAVNKFNDARAEMIAAAAMITNRGGSAATSDYWRNDADEVIPRDFDETIFDNAIGSWSAVNAFIVDNNHEDNFFGLLR